MDTTPITSALPVIDESAILPRIEDLELAHADGELTDAQRHELTELRSLVEQLHDFNSDDYFSPMLYRSDVRVPPGPAVDYRWVKFDARQYLAIATEEA